MYQVRWGADYLMKMIGSGTNADYLEIIYQVYLLPLLSNSHKQFVGRLWKGRGRIACASHVACQRHAVVSGPAMVTQAVLLSQWCYVFAVTHAGWLADQP